MKTPRKPYVLTGVLTGVLAGVLLGSPLISVNALAATELNDRALRQQTETSHSSTSVKETLDCSRELSKEACNRLQYERYAGQTQLSYEEFLRQETVNPLRHQVIKQPLLTQPQDNPATGPVPSVDPAAALNQLQNLQNTFPAGASPKP